MRWSPPLRAQTMALCCYDEAYTIPTPKAQRISLRTMQLPIEEIGLCDTVDPFGGSYYVETLTNQMEDKIVEAMNWVYFRRWNRKGGQRWADPIKVSRHAYERQKNTKSGALRKVGVQLVTSKAMKKSPISSCILTMKSAQMNRSAA